VGDCRAEKTATFISKVMYLCDVLLQYISDDSGHFTAVIIPIEEWKGIISKYPGVVDLDNDLPDWEKKLIDRNLSDIAAHPELLRPLEELFAELK